MDFSTKFSGFFVNRAYFLENYTFSDVTKTNCFFPTFFLENWDKIDFPKKPKEKFII